MQISEAQIEAFRAWYKAHVGKIITRGNAKKALEAALAAAPAVAVSIKPLEWIDDESGYQVARTPIGWYEFRPGKTMGKYTMKPGVKSSFGNAEQPFESEEAAKAAAQADYELRIRSTLLVAAEPVAWHRVETIIHPDVPAREDVTLNREVAKGWDSHPNTASLTPLFASPVAQATDGWRDISTAPRDGTFIIVYSPDMDRTAWASWQGRGDDAEWYGFDNYGLLFRSRLHKTEPTRWVSIPAAPTPKAESDGFPPFKPGIHVNELAGITEMVLEDVPTITGQEMTVRPLLRMDGERDIVGFQWDVPFSKLDGEQ